MKIPKKVSIGPHTYHIAKKRGAFLASTSSGCGWHDGVSDHDDLVFEINTRRGESQVASTLLHEIMHCIFRQSIGNCEEEEAVCEKMSQALLDVIRRNKLNFLDVI